MQKAIGFDLGGVIVVYSIPNQLELIAERLGVKTAKVRAVYDEVRPQLDIDGISNEQFWQELVRLSGSTADPESTKRLWSENYVRDNPIIEGMLELVDGLKKAGYRVGLLSNIDREHGEINAGRGIFEHFEEVLLSYQLRSRKPDQAAFEALWQRLEVGPAELIFIDDLDANVDAANALGITGIVFKSKDQLVQRLSELGVSL